MRPKQKDLCKEFKKGNRKGYFKFAGNDERQDKRIERSRYTPRHGLDKTAIRLVHVSPLDLVAGA